MSKTALVMLSMALGTAIFAVAHAQAPIEILPPLPPLEPVGVAPPPTEPDSELLPSNFGDAPPTTPGWYDLGYWFGPEIWDGSFQLGINGSEGNAQTFSLSTGFNVTRETESTKAKLDIVYAKAQAGSVETENNALLNARLDKKLSGSPWSLWEKFDFEYDEFKVFDVRLHGSGGVGRKVIDTTVTQLAGRLGAGASHEIGGVDDQWVAETVIGLDFEHKLTKRQKLTATFDYFPAWDRFMDFRLVSNSAWTIVLDEASNLSLKIGVNDRYDSTPNGAKPNDLDYSLLLLWKL